MKKGSFLEVLEVTGRFLDFKETNLEVLDFLENLEIHGLLNLEES